MRLFNWLPQEWGRRLATVTTPLTQRERRDHAMLAVLIGRGLRRSDSVSRDEMEQLRTWLEADHGIDFPALPFLYETIDQISSDGEVNRGQPTIATAARAGCARDGSPAIVTRRLRSARSIPFVNRRHAMSPGIATTVAGVVARPPETCQPSGPR